MVRLVVDGSPLPGGWMVGRTKRRKTMAHKTEGQCPVATDVFIRKQAKKLGVSLEKMIEDYALESETPKETIRHWVWPRKRSVKNDSKPKVKKLGDAAGVIQKGEIVDEDIKNDEGPDVLHEFRLLWKRILFVSEKLQRWSDGEIEPDDDAAVRGILAALPFMCLQAARVGIDLAKIHETFERESRISSSR
jgi:hypothetical protein